MNLFSVHIQFTDGSTKVVEYVSKIEVRDDVLWAYQDSYGGHRRHLGSWPLVNIKEWKREDD